MRNVCFKKALVVGIIVLFLGVGFQPALANEVSIAKTSDVEEDCLECQPVNRVDLLRVRLLLIRLETITNIILSKFGHIPDIEEKCGEILDIIHSNRVIGTLIFCISLYLLLIPMFLFGQTLFEIIEGLKDKPILVGILTSFLSFYGRIFAGLMYFWLDLC